MAPILRAAAVAAALAACLAWAGQVRADRTPVPPGSPAPGSDPAHATPLELLLTSAAAHLAGRTDLAVLCFDSAGWDEALAEHGVDGDPEGFVPRPAHDADGTITEDAPALYLSPQVCATLEAFATAKTKPTKCRTTLRVPRKETRLVRVRKRVHGRLVWRREKRVVVVTVKVTGPPHACPPGPDSPAAPPYYRYADALLAFAHETVHLAQDTAGKPLLGRAEAESRANCYGVQWLPRVAERAGDTRGDAQLIAWWLYVNEFNTKRFPPAYLSPDCREKGSLDLSPGDGVWP